VGTGCIYRSLQDDLSATARCAVSTIDWLVVIPSDGYTVGAGRQHDAVVGSLKSGALCENPSLGGHLVGTPGEVHLLMAGRTGSGYPSAVGVCQWRAADGTR
jgi:hypothetical protein